jgi:hypothetical protein
VSDSGLLALWRDAAEPGRREGLVSGVFACASLDCPCADVSLRLTRVDDGVRRIESEDGTITGFRDPTGPGVRCAPALTVSVDTRTGAVSPQGAVVDEGPLRWVEHALGGPLLEALWDRILAVRGIARGICQIDLAEWVPGNAISYDQVFPTARPDVYRVGATSYFALDLHCVNPACDCAEAVVQFYRTDADPAEYDGMIVVDTRAAAGEPPEPQLRPVDPARADILGALWAAFARRHDALPHLAARRAAVQAQSPRIEAAWRARQAARHDGKVGRNDPCPCGSGRKYKHCCLAR